jgi:hypothetical protein
VQKAAAAMRDYEAKLTKERELVVSKGLDALASAPAVEKVLTPGQSFKARLAYDADNLYYDPTPDGFIATVTIPLAELGWKPEPGGKVRLDLGYIFGNNAGMKATGRAYWANKGFAAGVLNDLPNESRLVPKEWGEARVEK